MTITESSDYVDLGDQFKEANLFVDAKAHFRDIYVVRLNTYEVALKEYFAKFEEPFSPERISHLSQDQSKLIIGTIYRQSQNKPSILRDIAKIAQEYVDSEDQTNVTQLITNRLDDEIWIEDMFQRVQLDIQSHSLVTGVPCAVFGRLSVHGTMIVEKMIEGCPPLPPPPILNTTTDQERYVVLTSGLNICNENMNLFDTQLLVDYLTGHLFGGYLLPSIRCSQLALVLIAGNSLGKSSKNDKVGSIATYLLRKSKPNSIDPLKYLDLLLLQLNKTKVVLMPGEYDPTSIMFPQRELDSCLFERQISCEFVTNPHSFSVGSVTFTGTSGQNIKDIQNLRDLGANTSTIDIVEQTLAWGQMCPTAPDTIPCLPITAVDPFAISKAPHVYFAGNQPHFEHRKTDDGTLLMSIPEFSNSGQIALVRLNDLHVESVCLRPKNHEHLQTCHQSNDSLSNGSKKLWTFEVD